MFLVSQFKAFDVSSRVLNLFSTVSLIVKPVALHQKHRKWSQSPLSPKEVSLFLQVSFLGDRHSVFQWSYYGKFPRHLYFVTKLYISRLQLRDNVLFTSRVRNGNTKVCN